MQSIWQAANEAATGELAALRAEARLQASEAEAQRDLARAAVVVAEQENAASAGRARRGAERTRSAAGGTGRRAPGPRRRAGASGGGAASDRGAGAAIGRVAYPFLNGAGAYPRAGGRGTESGPAPPNAAALREIDQERTLRQKGEQAVADLRTELAAVQARAQDAAVAGAEERARLQAERDTLSRQLAEAEQAIERGQAAQEELRAELGMAVRRAERAAAGSHRDAPPGIAQARGAGDAHQVQARAGLRGTGGVGWNLSTAGRDKPVDKPRGGRVPTTSAMFD
ncbi:hypothetical protein ACU4GD_28465 [Cupriavidus basilensis]